MLLIITLLIFSIPGFVVIYMVIGFILAGQHKKSISDCHTIAEIDIQFQNEINEIKRKNEIKRNNK